MLQAVPITVARVDDWERAVRFYRDELGLSPREVDPEGGWARFAFPDGGATLAVVRCQPGESAGVFLNLLTNDLDADAARFPVREAPVPGHGYRTVWVQDPCGIRHQLFSWDPPRP
jgi:catechol 2,3-dioxygenase-like lactoylglutathione lyase family enzyme